MKRCFGSLCLVLVLHGFPSGAAAADELMGASNIMVQVMAGPALNDALAADPKEAVIRKLAADLSDFAKKRDSMNPEQAAQAWTDLFDRLWKINARDLSVMVPDEGDDSEGSISFTRLFSEIPGPAAWPVLQKLAANRKVATGADSVRDCGLQLFTAYLCGDTKAFDTRLEKSDQLLPGEDRYQRESVLQAVKRIKTVVESARSVTTPEDVLKHYRKMLEEFARDTDSPSDGRQIQIPDLVSLAGAAEAEKLLLQTIKLPVELQIPSGGQTKELLKKVVTSKTLLLKRSQWHLIDSPADVALYEAMNTRFPTVEKKEARMASATSLFTGGGSGMDDYEAQRATQSRPNATLCYLVGLVATGRSDEAVKIAMAMKAGDVGDNWPGILQRVDQPHVSQALFDFAGKVMKNDSLQVFQSMYGSLALSLGHTNALFSSLEARMNDTDASDSSKRRARASLIQACLAVDDTEKAIVMLQAKARDKDKDKDKDKEGDGQEPLDDEEGSAWGSAATLLVQLGDALGRPELIDEGLKVFLSADEKQSGRGFSSMPQIYYGRHMFSESLDDLMIRNDRTVELEKLIKASMRSQISEYEKRKQMGGAERLMLDGELGRLANLYGKLGRHQDVLYLARNAGWWSAGDLADIQGGYGFAGMPVAVYIAAALASSGLSGNATAILKSHLYNAQGDDKAYSVLVGIEGAALIPWLDKLYERDRFEERPLIWKAEILRKTGKLEEAEKTVRAALKVDPTDGEQPPGDRVRAYAVLADVLADMGKKDDALFFRNVVKSVRVAEDGDKLTAIGLMKRSIKKYEEAEVAFADAYCVQWRLAERLHSMGKFEEAEKHYQIAFERMPEQFGQVANFCFGCEGVFEKEHSRSVAERVLTKLLQTHTVSPQVHFMMGQLRQAQGRETEAYLSFKKAVELDPGYLDAWGKMGDLSRLLLLPQSERDAIALKGLEMDPLGIHFSAGRDSVQDLKALWTVLEKNMKHNVEPPKDLFVFEASRNAIDAEKKKQGVRSRQSRGWYNSNRMKPGQVLVSQQTASMIIQLIQTARYSSMGMGDDIF